MTASLRLWTKSSWLILKSSWKELMSRARDKSTASTGRYCARKAIKEHGLPKYTSVPKWLTKDELIEVVAIMKFDKIPFDDALCIFLSMKPV